jgi:hypothetical protein
MIRGEKKDLTSGVTPHPMPGGLVSGQFLGITSARGTAPRSPSPFIDQKCEKTFRKQIIRSVGRTERYHLIYYAKGDVQQPMPDPYRTFTLLGSRIQVTSNEQSQVRISNNNNRMNPTFQP